MSTAPAPPPLAKQTVAQLKAACQQRGIKGYSKWTKAQLIDALAAASGNGPAPQPAPNVTPVPSDATDPHAARATPVAKPVPKPKTPKRSRTKSGAAAAAASAPAADASTDSVPPKAKKPRKSKTDAAPSSTAPSLPAHINPPSPDKRVPTERLGSEASMTPPAATTTDTAKNAQNSPAQVRHPSSITVPTSPPLPKPPSAPKRVSKLPTTKPPQNAAQVASSKARSDPGKPVVHGRKFTALKAATVLLKATAPPTATKPVWPFPGPSLPDTAAAADRVSFMQQHFLERLFTSMNAAREEPPTPPPWAGSHWPSSALAFQGFHPRIYELDSTSFLVAVRWWVARLYALLQLGSGEDWSAGAGAMGILGPDMAAWPAVVECRRIAGDIYLVVTEAQSSEGNEDGKKRKVTTPPPATTRYIALGTTGDVLGSSLDAARTEDVLEGCGVRADWAGYIRALPPTCIAAPLLALVKTKDAVAAPSGINRAWRTRAETADETTAIAVAERAVLASCTMNSGTKLSAAQMDAEWLSHTADLGVSRGVPRASFATADKPFPPRAADVPSPQRKVELYLPEPLQILSVHLLAHPALALVHRASGKSDYVLADTGHTVGDEDGGVVPLWQGMLACSATGEYQDQGAFWAGWQARVRVAGESGDGGSGVE